MTDGMCDAQFGGQLFETGTSASVRARHVMPGMPPPEGVVHEHDYRLHVRVTRPDLDDRGMVVDLDAMEGALAVLVGQVADTDLEHVTGIDVVTVELFARWAHQQLAVALRGSEGVLQVRVFETAEKYGGYTAPLLA